MELFDPSAWLEGMYLAALKAASRMADAMGETDKRDEYTALFEKGYQWTKDNLFNGRYFIHKVDLADRTPAEHFNCLSYWNEEKGQLKYQIGDGCEIDQMLGQWHAAISGRYDGYKRNPLNEIECGSSYACPMVSFALLPIFSGFKSCDLRPFPLHERMNTHMDPKSIEVLADRRRQEIRLAPDTLVIPGTTYYVSSAGCDENDGLSPETAWQSLSRVSEAPLQPGDGVRFRRGDVFRGSIQARSGVAYAAFGTGEKPRLYGWDRDLADPALWTAADESRHIWRLVTPILDPGTLVFNEGEQHCRKLIPSYLDGAFMCRGEETRPFEMAQEMTQDLDLFWHFDAILTTQPSKGEDFPIPSMEENSLGDLYLRCDAGNPGEVFASIEALPRRAMFRVGSCPHVRIDNLCIRYVGLHGVAAGGHVTGLHVTNCEFAWIGGTIQHYFGTDPNYPQGRRGTVTRFGNAIEIYGGCDDYLVENCFIDQVYDAGITHQITTCGNRYAMTHIRYRNNLVERCVYGIEYFLDMTEGDTHSFMKDVEMTGNILRLSGCGWGQQRHNTDTPALIKGWSYVNAASDYVIQNNIFDRCAYRLLHLVAQHQSSCPRMDGNTYIQPLGGCLGQYGGQESGEPPMLPFDENAKTLIRTVLGDENAVVAFADLP